jgi:hypothetical protein
VSNIGITTDLLECNRPGQKPFLPGPPFNWQPQKTFPVTHVKGGPKVSFTAAFNDRINGFPETMTMDAMIASTGIAGKVTLYADDNTAASGEEICHTRGFVSFSGKHS